MTQEVRKVKWKFRVREFKERLRLTITPEGAALLSSVIAEGIKACKSETSEEMEKAKKVALRMAKFADRHNGDDSASKKVEIIAEIGGQDDESDGDS